MRYRDDRNESSPRLRFGKYRGWALSDVPMSYLAWLLEEARIDGGLQHAIRTEIADRLGLGDYAQDPHRTARQLPAPGVAQAAQEIVTAGFRRIAHERHPDHGGAHGAMIDLSAARDFLQRAVERGVAA